jgi:hypothetical protein
MSDEMPPEVTDEKIYEDLQQYQEMGVIDYVLPTDPLGEQWIVGHQGCILKFTTKEGIVGFLTGISVCAQFMIAQRKDPLARFLAGNLR